MYLHECHDFASYLSSAGGDRLTLMPFAPVFPYVRPKMGQYQGNGRRCEVAIVGLTVCHLYMINRWRSDCYARRKEPKGMHIRREVTEDCLTLKGKSRI
jgi:hypothetical protein